MQGNPFARANMMMAAIAAAMSLGGSAQREAMAGIGPYVSRGKGRGKGAKWLGGSTRSKYTTPHIGAKEQERSKRCYMETHFQPVEAPDKRGFQTCHPRSAPVLCQMSKATHEAYIEAREQEYESVF
jgi:hypothetical protein